MNCHTDVFIVPIGDLGHASESLGRALRVAHYGDLVVRLLRSDILNSGWQVVNAVLGPVHGPELRLIDRVLVVLLGVRDTRVVCQVNIVATIGHFERHGLVSRLQTHGPS